jgi:drug/metabolite transporter (DMT)-like permease
LRNFIEKNKAYLALVIVCFTWGSTWIASKEGVKHMPAFQLVAIRQFFGALAFLAYFIFTKKFSWPNKTQWKTILVLTFLNFVCSNALSTWGVKYISSGLGAIIGTIYPIWLVIILYFFKERVPKKAILGMCISFIGICVIFQSYLGDFANPNFTKGILASVTAAFTWALCTYYTRKYGTIYNPYLSLGIQMLISSALIYGTCYITGQTIPLHQIPESSWYAILYLVIIGSIISFVCFIYFVNRLSPSVSSIYAYINPIVAIFVGVLYFGEKTAITTYYGMPIVLFGIYFINKALKRK